MQTKMSAQKAVRKTKKRFAIFMLPIFLLQMVSANLLFLAVPQAHADENVTAVVNDVAVSNKTEEKKADPVAEALEKKAPVEKNEKINVSSDEAIVAKSDAIKEDVKKETLIDVAVEDEKNVTSLDVANPATSEMKKDELASVQTVPTIDPMAASIEKPLSQADQSKTASKPLWLKDGNKATTSEVVELGKTYVSLQNYQVTVTFTKLPDKPGTLSIEEIELTKEQVKSLGALSNKAYDVTSSMENGTFEYDLTLPKPKNEKNVQIKFAEDVSKIEDAQTVANDDMKNSATSVSTTLDHFTLFVVTNSSGSSTTITASAGANGTISPSGATVVNTASSVTYTITPDAGYIIDNVLVDGVSVGAVVTYDFASVVANHTISASFILGQPPVINSLIFGNRVGIVTGGNVVDLNIGGITDADLANPAGNLLNVSKAGTFSIKTPLTLTPLAVSAGNNPFGVANFLGFPLNAAQLQQAFAISGNEIWTTGTLVDTSGNSTDFTIKIFYNVLVDTTAPVISLVGSTPITVALGSTYVDAGATAFDNVDGNITGKIVTVNSVNTSLVGAYTVTYDVSDLAGNAAIQVVRTVNVTNQSTVNAPPVITAFSYAGQTGQVNTTGDVINISIPDPTKLNLSLGNIAVSANSTLQVDFPPIPSGMLAPISLNSGDNIKSITSIFGFPDAIVAADLIATASLYPGGTIPISGVLTDGFNQSTNITINMTVDATYPTIGAMTFANRAGIVSAGDTVAINLSGVSNAELASIGSIDVSEKSVLQIISPLPTGAIQLNAGVNNLGTMDIFGFNILASELMSTAILSNGNILVLGTLTDSIGNVSNITINITVDIPPVITLSGTSPINVEYGSVYVDQGATAFDNEDGVITNSIVTSGVVDTSILGQYTITYNVTDSAGNVAVPVTRIVNVVPRAITITADPQIKTYGDADPTLTYQITSGNLIGSDALAGAPSRTAGENVGVYAISSALVNNNYAITFVSANLIITERAITVSADLNSKVYGSGDPVLTYQITSGNLVGSDALAGSLSRASGENVGFYAINQGTLTAGSNYALTFVGNNFEITKATLTITADDKIKGLISPDPTFTFIPSGFVNGDNSSAIGVDPVCAVAVPHANIGMYPIVCSGGSSSNYNFSYVDGTLTVVIDTTAPVITLLGSNPVNIELGLAYVDAGATAMDNVDGDITSKIVTANPVNTGILGTYVVTYDVSDSSGNAATQVIRTVNVIAPVVADNGGGGDGGGGHHHKHHKNHKNNNHKKGNGNNKLSSIISTGSSTFAGSSLFDANGNPITNQDNVENQDNDQQGSVEGAQTVKGEPEIIINGENKKPNPIITWGIGLLVLLGLVWSGFKVFAKKD